MANNPVPGPSSRRDGEENLKVPFEFGSVVVAKVGKHPWWPAMIDLCTETGDYRLDSNEYPARSHYHLLFFDVPGKVSRSWVHTSKIRHYPQMFPDLLTEQERAAVQRLKKTTPKRRLVEARCGAEAALRVSIEERRLRYSLALEGNVTQFETTESQGRGKRRSSTSSSTSTLPPETTESQRKGKRRLSTSSSTSTLPPETTESQRRGKRRLSTSSSTSTLSPDSPCLNEKRRSSVASSTSTLPPDTDVSTSRAKRTRRSTRKAVTGPSSSTDVSTSRTQRALRYSTQAAVACSPSSQPTGDPLSPMEEGDDTDASGDDLIIIDEEIEMIDLTGDDAEACQFRCGEVVYANLKGLPVWPALIMSDPESGIWFMPTSATAPCRIHIEFLHENRKAWVQIENLSKFEKYNTHRSEASRMAEAYSKAAALTQVASREHRLNHCGMRERGNIGLSSGNVIDLTDDDGEACPFSLGEVVFANLKGRPLWPAIVIFDPEIESWFMPKLRCIHVQFFHVNWRAWVPLTQVARFEQEPSSPPDETDKRFLSYYKALSLSWIASKERRFRELKDIQATL